jgi:hypothetical protein
MSPGCRLFTTLPASLGLLVDGYICMHHDTSPTYFREGASIKKTVTWGLWPQATIIYSKLLSSLFTTVLQLVLDQSFPLAIEPITCMWTHNQKKMSNINYWSNNPNPGPNYMFYIKHNFHLQMLIIGEANHSLLIFLIDFADRLHMTNWAFPEIIAHSWVTQWPGSL